MLFNGLFGTVYEDRTLSGTIPNQMNGFGTVAVPFQDIDSPGNFARGIGLVDNDNNPLMLVRYVFSSLYPAKRIENFPARRKEENV